MHPTFREQPVIDTQGT